jgi:hypothetical protein
MTRSTGRRAAAVQHRGIVLQPSLRVAAQLASGAPVEVLPQYRSIELRVCAVCRSRKYRSPKARALIHFLVQALRMRAWPARARHLHESSVRRLRRRNASMSDEGCSGRGRPGF